jgi:hypothetical protein
MPSRREIAGSPALATPDIESEATSSLERAPAQQSAFACRWLVVMAREATLPPLGEAGAGAGLVRGATPCGA